MKIDEFFNKQPQKNFQKDLENFYVPKLLHASIEKKGFIRLSGAFLQTADFSGEKLLEKSFDNFNAFLEQNDLNGKSYPILLVKTVGEDTESFTYCIDEERCSISACGVSGIRRALVYIQDQILINGGFLKIEKAYKEFDLEVRLARCFFAPINRPPKNLAELDDDVDYYPDAYLDRLMRDGANAVWVYADLDQLAKSSYIKEFGQDSEKRINKLNRIIDKCALYGIKVYLLIIAPMSLDEPTIKNRYPGIEKKYPQVAGNDNRGPKGFCTYTEFGKGYLTEAIQNVVKSAKNLGGIIDITFGERVTSCGNTWPDLEGAWHNDCPHCADKTQMEIVTHTAKIIKNAIDSANSQVEFISWTYGHRGQPLDVIGEYVDKCPDNVVMLQNYEDDGRVVQLGKKRFALDYYLSYTGPSEMFKFTAKKAVQQEKKIYAKMQVCCSHELATVPYIPVPGIIYDKIISAKRQGVSGVMESWLFGNYPCLMSKAVGLLCAKNDFLTKEDFLLKLASLYWSEQDAQKVALAWDYFEKAYSNYPVNVMFNYYGPMHDGVVWELSLLPKNKPLSRSWQLQDVPNGDRIGECLFKGHTIDEAIELSNILCENWQKGLEILAKTTEWNNPRNEQLSVAKALGVLFESGRNVLRFYQLRDKLGYQIGNLNEILNQMIVLVEEEIKNSVKMIPLCESDNRLGYHSEAEGYKFFPEKLKSRVEKLKGLLETEFPKVKERIEKGLIPLPYYGGDEHQSIKAGLNGLDSAEWGYLDDDESKFRIAVGEYIEIEIKSNKKQNFCIDNEFRLFFPEPTLVIRADGKIVPFIEAGHQSLLDENREEELLKWKVENLSGENNLHVIARIKKDESSFIKLPYKFLITTYDGARWCVDNEPCYTLGKCLLSPNDFGWIK